MQTQPIIAKLVTILKKYTGYIEQNSTTVDRVVAWYKQNTKNCFDCSDHTMTNVFIVFGAIKMIDGVFP